MHNRRIRIALLLTPALLLMGLWLASGTASFAKPLMTVFPVASCDEAGFNAALALAQADAISDTVSMASCSGEIAFSSTKTIFTPVVITGHGITFTMTTANRHFVVNVPGKLALLNMTLKDGTSPSDGGSIQVNGGDLVTSNVTFTNNNAPSGEGGAIYITTGTAKLSATQFMHNSATEDGGAISTVSSSLWITESLFYSNTSQAELVASYGGAVNAFHNTITKIVDTEFTLNNKGGSEGGAVGINAGEVDIRGSTFISNSVSYSGSAKIGWGGALSIKNADPVLIDGSTFQGNYAFGDGAAIFLMDSRFQILDSTFRGNYGDHFNSQGAAIFASTPLSGSLLSGLNVVDNYAFAQGGGLYAVFGSGSNAYIDIENSTFSNNRASFDSAIQIFTILAENTSTSHLTNVTIDSNPGAVADTHALGVNNTPVDINFATFADNQVAIEIEGTSDLLTIHNSVLRSQGANCTGDTQFVVANRTAMNDASCEVGGSDNIAITDLPLDVLANNGGLGKTRLPLAGSVVVDAVPLVDCLPFDQRGMTRPQGASCDMGAVELSILDLDPADATATAIANATATAQADATATANAIATATAAQATVDAQATLTAQPPQSATPSPTFTPSSTPTATPTSPQNVATPTPSTQVGPNPNVTLPAPKIFLNPINKP